MTDTTPIRVALSGVTGWAGAALARGIVAAPDLRLVAGIARRAAGRSVGDALGVDCEAPVVATAAEAVAHRADVFFEFSKPDVALDNVLAAIGAGAHVVVGTSGLSNEDYARVDAAARAAGRGVLACGNFAITAVLLQKFAEMAVKWLPDVELIDYAYEGKVDVPSGTVRELSVRLGAARGDALASALPTSKLRGPVETRGASMSGIPVHSVRLPGYVLGAEAVFGAPDQRLHLRHEAGAGAEIYVQGALLAIRRVSRLTGVVRGLDRVMEG
jgi:4-hydroxy-tetrahydrodipicolinate reductase